MFFDVAVVRAELHVLNANFKRFAKLFKMFRAWLNIRKGQGMHLHIQYAAYTVTYITDNYIYYGFMNILEGYRVIDENVKAEYTIPENTIKVIFIGHYVYYRFIGSSRNGKISIRRSFTCPLL